MNCCFCLFFPPNGMWKWEQQTETVEKTTGKSNRKESKQKETGSTGKGSITWQEP
jgi:hypothetical protein